MPCYDERNSPSYVREETRQAALEEYRHNSPVAELLCWTLKSMEQETRVKFLAHNKDLATWWGEHRTRDAEKAIEERLEKRRKFNAAKKELEAAQRKFNEWAKAFSEDADKGKPHGKAK